MVVLPLPIALLVAGAALLAIVSAYANSWVASKAVEMMERRYAACQACPTCREREREH